MNNDLRNLIPRTPRRRDYANYSVELCPFHEDSKPSLLIYPNRWICKAGCGSGDAADYLTKAKGISRGAALREVGHVEPYARAVPRPKEDLPQSLGLKYHLNLSAEDRDWYRGRGLLDSTIDRFQLGYGVPPGGRFGRFTIPVMSGGVLHNVRFRRDDRCPVCRSDEWTEELDKDGTWWCVACQHTWKHQDHNAGAKYAGVASHNEARLFNVDCLSPPPRRVFICEGELDALMLVQSGYDAVSITSGCSASLLPFNMLFLPVRLCYVVYDSDAPGQKGADAVIEVLPKARRIILPEKDITAYLLKHSKEEFESVIAEADKQVGNNLLLGISNGLMRKKE